MINRPALLGALLVVAALYLLVRPEPCPSPRSTPAKLNLDAPTLSTRWGLPISVSVKARSTPLVGQPLTLEVHGYNGHRNGRFRAWLEAPPGAMEPLDGPSEWEGDLGLGQEWVHQFRVTVLSKEPFAVRARLKLLTPEVDHLPPGESALVLYPFEMVGGVVRHHWNLKTGLAVGAPAPELTRGSDGRESVRHSVVGATATYGSAR
ncbi:MAG: hypothetical protein HY815_33340 [Candidatus Riflebacteria bacterium]|nr:hypothetical protein [Candidatus Riflebacteria bacterium]